MELKIGKYLITTDRYNFIVRDGETAEPLAYLPTLEYVVKWVLQKRLRKSAARTVEELKVEIIDAKQEIVEAVRQIGEKNG